MASYSSELHIYFTDVHVCKSIKWDSLQTPSLLLSFALRLYHRDISYRLSKTVKSCCNYSSKYGACILCGSNTPPHMAAVKDTWAVYIEMYSTKEHLALVHFFSILICQELQSFNKTYNNKMIGQRAYSWIEMHPEICLRIWEEQCQWYTVICYGHTCMK